MKVKVANVATGSVAFDSLQVIVPVEVIEACACEPGCRTRFVYSGMLCKQLAGDVDSYRVLVWGDEHGVWRSKVLDVRELGEMLRPESGFEYLPRADGTRGEG